MQNHNKASRFSYLISLCIITSALLFSLPSISYAVGGVVGDVSNFAVRTTNSVSNWLVGSPASSKKTAPAAALRRLNATQTPSGKGWTNKGWRQFVARNKRDVDTVVKTAKKDSDQQVQAQGVTLESNYTAAANFANNLSKHPSTEECNEMKDFITHYLSDARAISSSVNIK